jgi:hypothetical protein
MAMHLSNGDTYEGDFKDGKFHGKGVFVSKVYTYCLDRRRHFYEYASTYRVCHLFYAFAHFFYLTCVLLHM